jgi:hypothetical protein
MPRRPQHRGSKGSLKWMQDLVNSYPSVLNESIGHGPIEWLSPLANDDYAEYWDDSFLTRLGLTLRTRPLRSFWPRSGPRWDALGRIRGGAVVLVEAKAHIVELESTCRAVPASKSRIQRAFDEVSRGWQIPDVSIWCESFYQYANRLAHVFLLNELNATPAFLVFLHFIGATEVGGPLTREAWDQAIATVHWRLGISNKLPPYVIDAFVDVSGAQPVAA